MSDGTGEKPLASGNQPERRGPTFVGNSATTREQQAPTPKRPGPKLIGDNASTSPLSGGGSGGGSIVATVTGPTTTVPSPTPMSDVQPPQSRPASGRPKMVGAVRERVSVDVAVLERAFPNIPPAVLNRVRLILQETFLDTLNAVSCSQWGMDAQRRYGKLADKSLGVLSDSHLEAGIAHTTRLQGILAEIGESAQENDSGGGFLGGLFGSGSRRNPKEVFGGHQREIEQLKDRLEAILQNLRRAQTRFAEINAEAEVLAVEIDAWSIGALYLADTLGAAHELSSHLGTQGLALAKVVASIQQGRSTRDANAAQIDALADRIQDVVLGVLPSWMEGIAATLIQNALTPTDRRTIRDGVGEIIDRLKL